MIKIGFRRNEKNKHSIYNRNYRIYTTLIEMVRKDILTSMPSASIHGRLAVVNVHKIIH